MAARQILVKNAMAQLKKRKGASLTQIQQHLESSYSGKIDVKNKKLLTTILKGLVKNGQVEKQGTNYRLAQVARMNVRNSEVVPHQHHGRKHHRSLHHGRRHHRKRHGGRHHKRRRGRHHKRRRGRHHKRRRGSRRRHRR